MLFEGTPALGGIDIQNVHYCAHEEIGGQKAANDAEGEPPVLNFHVANPPLSLHQYVADYLLHR